MENTALDSRPLDTRPKEVQFKVKYLPSQTWDTIETQAATIKDNEIEAWLQGYSASFQRLIGDWPIEIRWNYSGGSQGNYWKPDTSKSYNGSGAMW